MLVTIALLAPLLLGRTPADHCYLITNKLIEIIPCASILPAAPPLPPSRQVSGRDQPDAAKERGKPWRALAGATPNQPRLLQHTAKGYRARVR